MNNKDTLKAAVKQVASTGAYHVNITILLDNIAANANSMLDECATPSYKAGASKYWDRINDLAYELAMIREALEPETIKSHKCFMFLGGDKHCVVCGKPVPTPPAGEAT